MLKMFSSQKWLKNSTALVKRYFFNEIIIKYNKRTSIFYEYKMPKKKIVSILKRHFSYKQVVMPIYIFEVCWFHFLALPRLYFEYLTFKRSNQNNKCFYLHLCDENHSIYIIKMHFSTAAILDIKMAGYFLLKDAIPVFFGQTYLHLKFLTIFELWNILPKIWETAKCSYPCMLKYNRKNKFVEKVWSATSALFFHVSTHCVATVKKLDNNRFFQLIRWPRSNESDWDATGAVFNFRLWQESLCFTCVLLRFFNFVVQNALFVTMCI